MRGKGASGRGASLALVAELPLASGGVAVYVGGREWRKAATRIGRSPGAGGSAP